MLRRSLHFLSDSPVAKRAVTGTAFSRRMAERFVAGDTLAEAIAAAQQLNRDGLTVTLDFLGEAVTDRAEAEAATEMAVRCLEQLAEHGVEGNISIKPSQLGLDIDEDFCRANLERVLARGRELGREEGEIFVRLDMESSEYTERTVRLTEQLWESGFRNVGTVLQSYMRRTPSDVERLNALGSRVRLVKGAYREPEAVAFQEKSTVDRMFVEEMKVLLEAGFYPAIATHDEAMVEATRHWAFEKGISKDAFEFQMLYGIRRDLQHKLLEDGYRVRIYVPFGDSWYPYLMRRMAERPANLFFIVGNVVKESGISRAAKPIVAGVGVAAGALAGLALRRGRGRE
jgi:proline dehydrogenase